MKRLSNTKSNFTLRSKLLNAQEVTMGPKLKYTVYVQTGERPGSSTQAKIRMKLFGDRYDDCIKTTKWITLDDSLTHKVPFQRGYEDIFEIEIFDIGKLRAITIGHMEKDISNSFIQVFCRFIHFFLHCVF